MTSLISPATVRIQVATDLSDADLQSLIDREEAQMVAACGAHAGPIVETLTGGVGSLFTTRPISSVTSITEAYPSNTTSPVTLAATQYVVWGPQGRIQRTWGIWRPVCVVTYTPVGNTSDREAVLIELTRIAIERTAMRAETMQGGPDRYSYTAPDWDLERKRLYRRIGFVTI